MIGNNDASTAEAAKMFSAANLSAMVKVKRFVFLVLWIQLLCFCILEYFGLFTPGGRGLFQQWRWMLHLGIAGFFLTLLIMFVKQKSPPWSYFVIFLWTFSGGYGVAAFVMTYDLDVFFVSCLCTLAALLLCFSFWSSQTLQIFTSGRVVALVSVAAVVAVSLIAQNILFLSTYELVQSVIMGLFLTLYTIAVVYRLCNSPKTEHVSACIAEVVIGVYLAFFNPLEYWRTVKFLTGNS